MPGVQATGGGITVSTMSYGLLFDIDGVMVTSWQALPGADIKGKWLMVL